MSYRSDVDALAARHEALANELATKTRELDTARHLLDDAKARAHLPVLPNIRVASPCSADWKLMTGDEQVRACGLCEKNVYNLSSMTREEAEALILAKEGKLCVRYFQRKDGTILLKDCTIGTAQRRKRRLIAAGAAALLAGGVAYKLSRPICGEPKLAGAVSLEPVVEPVSSSVAHEVMPREHEYEAIMGDYVGPEPVQVKMGKMIRIDDIHRELE